jgi:hypothetical protein
LWRNQGLDPPMRLYGIIPTGFIKVVPNAVTEDSLMKKHGFYNCIKDPTIIDQFLKQIIHMKSNSKMSEIILFFKCNI